MQAGNSIGGAISQDGRLVIAQNYEPGVIKVFDAATLELLSGVPSVYGSEGKRSKVVGLAHVPGNRVAYALFDAGEIWVVDLADPRKPAISKFKDVGRQPYDGLGLLAEQDAAAESSARARAVSTALRQQKPGQVKS